MGVWDRYIDVLVKRCKHDRKKLERLAVKLSEWSRVEEERQKEAEQS